MLRGSRHEGIPTNQSARERDRQRERQRQERAQMLPNVDKDATVNLSQDLFHPPRQVKPSVEDQTSLEIRKTLGNFESVRQYMLDNSSRRLIGVDQLTAGSATPSAAGSNSIPAVDKQRLPLTPGGGSGSTTSPSLVVNKSFHPTSHRNFIQGPVSTAPSALSNTSVNLFRPSNPVQKVPQIQSQPQPQNFLAPPAQHFNQVVNSTHQLNSSSSSSNSSSTQVNPLRNSNNTSTNYTHIHTNNLNVSSSEVAPSTETLVAKVDRVNNSVSVINTEKSLRTGAPSAGAPSAGVPSDKNVGSVTNNRPAFERADSQLELENMLREMMDVKTPISAIQTPLKESPIKKFSQRRSSKEENIVQNTTNNSVAKVVSSPKSSKMDSSGDSSSNGDSSSESDSEDSSSGSPGGDNADSIASKNMADTVNSPTRNWGLSTLMSTDNKKDNINIKGVGVPDSSVLSKSPKQDVKPRKNLLGNLNSEDPPQDVPTKPESSVTSTSVFGKPLTSSPLEPSSVGLSHLSKVPGKSPRRTPDTRSDPYIPAKPLPISVNTTKGISSIIPPSFQGPSLSGSSSEDEAPPPPAPAKTIKDPPPPRIAIPEPKPLPIPVVNSNVNAGRKRRKQSASSSERNIPKSEDDSSPETKAKSKKVVQDTNKNNMIGKLFRGRKKDSVESPGAVEKVKSTSRSSSSSSSTKPASSNRVSAKDNGKKNAATPKVSTITPPTSLVQNGELEASSKSTGSSGNTKNKKKENTSSTGGKRTSTTVPDHHSAKRHQKANAPITANSTGVTTLAPPPASSVVRVKENYLGPLMCKIHLNKIPTWKIPISAPSKSSSRKSNPKPPPLVKPDKSGRITSEHSGKKEDSNRVGLHYDYSRVGSSSDHANDIHDQAPRLGPLGDGPAGSESDRLSANNHSLYSRKRRKSRSSPRKSKAKVEPDSHSKIEADSIVSCEVSSNVIGYTASVYDPVLVSTSRTPPAETDVAQAPDSSLNPPHLPSLIVLPQVNFYSYFEKMDHNDSDYFTRGQETYLEEAKRLKHKADREESGLQAQASTYLEAGLYFILAGNSIERERSQWSREAFTMYKDTLTLIKFIGSRFRSRQENSNEAKITVLSLRCQSLLALKLFKMRMKETKEVAAYLNDHFQKTPPDMLQMANSPQLSTPSPRSPTLSPAGSSGILMGLTPSPHHPQQNHQSQQAVQVSRTLYGNMYKQCTNTMNLISTHELWDAADNMVEKYHIEEFFISIDRIYGPLTLHTHLMDLVRYVRHGLGVLKNCSDLS